MQTNSDHTSAVPGSDTSPPQHTLAKHRLASHPEAKPETLEKLGEKGDTHLSERVAENANTPPATLDKLAGHDCPEVRLAVADNQATPQATIESLAGDPNPDVRFRVAENPETPVAILETLAEDENPYVVARAEDTLKSILSVAEQANDMLLREKFADAEHLYKQLVTGLEELLGAGHPEVGKALHKLAAVLAAQDRIDEARTVADRARAIKSSEGGQS